MFNCKMCNEFSSKTNHGLSQHIRFSHKITAAEYRVKYDGKTVKCVSCGKDKPYQSKYSYCPECYQNSPERKNVAKSNVLLRRTYNGIENPHYKGLIKKQCPCGENFEVYPARKKTALYCSRSCKHRYCVSVTKVTIYKETRFKSRWEAAFAKWCDQNNLSWEYEKQQIPVGKGWYVPDFFIKQWNCFVEVKGFWRPDAKEKFDLVSKEHKIKLVDKSWFLNHGFQCKPREGIFISIPGDFI